MNDDLPAKPRPPAAVRNAVLCLWASWAVGWVSAFMLVNDPSYVNSMMEQMEQMQSGGIAVPAEVMDDPEAFRAMMGRGMSIGLGLGALISAGIAAFVLSRVKRGQDWARILCLVVGAFNFFTLFNLPGGFYTILVLGQLGLGYYALYLLFTRPGADWFRPRAQGAVESKDSW